MAKYIARRKKIGKKIGYCLYIHKSVINTLEEEEAKLVDKMLSTIKAISFDYCIIKIDTYNNQVSFIESPNWDIANEPFVGDSILMSEKGLSYTKSKNQIYHHKWMFVDDNYNGFDVKLAKQRSEKWMNHPDVIKMKADIHTRFSSKIGYKDYWDANVCSILDIGF